ncbi:MAG: hypothetical protein ACHQRM_16915 [Bacteroidia bacterium]
MTQSFVDNLFCDGYYLFFRGWILHTGVPSWKISKKIVLYSNTHNIQIIPEVNLRPDVSAAFNPAGTSGANYINYDQAGFVLKILKQNLPNDYFNIRIEINSDSFSDSVTLNRMIYV